MATCMEETTPQPGQDYYVLPNGKWVFTARYLLARGSCCRSGCRDCPYGYSPDRATLPGKSTSQIVDSNAPM